MSFDFGELLSRSFQITWRHKILWVFSALPALLSLLILPAMFVPVVFMDERSFNNPFFIEEPTTIVLFIAFSIFITLLSYVLYGISSSSVMLGAKRADAGVEGYTFNELFNGSRPFWWRVLGVMLLIGLGAALVFLLIFGCFAVLGAVTMGIGFICLQPLFLLMYPLMMVLYGIIELSQAGVVVDELGVADAIRRGWELVRANFWRILLISLVVHLGIGFLSSIVMLPLMSPFFLFPFLMESRNFDFHPRMFMLILGGFSLIFIPVMAFVQGVGITFLKSTYTLVYLRLTKPQANVPLVEKNE